MSIANTQQQRRHPAATKMRFEPRNAGSAAREMVSAGVR